jgi:hypothetical protein
LTRAIAFALAARARALARAALAKAMAFAAIKMAEPKPELLSRWRGQMAKYGAVVLLASKNHTSTHKKVNWPCIPTHGISK